MHWKDARAPGDSQERLYSLDAWRDSRLFYERDRPAFSETERAQLAFAITAINSWNRLMSTAAVEPGHDEPSMRARPMSSNLCDSVA
jgi:alkylhydroperoxidase family enzyme